MSHFTEEGMGKNDLQEHSFTHWGSLNLLLKEERILFSLSADQPVCWDFPASSVVQFKRSLCSFFLGSLCHFTCHTSWYSWILYSWMCKTLNNLWGHIKLTAPINSSVLFFCRENTVSSLQKLRFDPLQKFNSCACEPDLLDALLFLQSFICQEKVNSSVKYCRSQSRG